MTGESETAAVRTPVGLTPPPCGSLAETELAPVPDHLQLVVPDLHQQRSQGHARQAPVSRVCYFAAGVSARLQRGSIQPNHAGMLSVKRDKGGRPGVG